MTAYWYKCRGTIINTLISVQHHFVDLIKAHFIVNCRIHADESVDFSDSMGLNRHGHKVNIV